MNCSNLQDNICRVATNLCRLEVVPDPKACEFCTKCKQPQDINEVTASLAIARLAEDGKEVPPHLVTLIETKQLYKAGPGTELKKLISWFIWLRDVDGCKACYNRESQMNQWGPEGCRSNINIIVDWLRESAAKHKLPFSETLVKILINKAIRNSEKHYEVVRSSNNSST